MTDVPDDFFEAGESEELYKILRESEVDCQNVIAPEEYTLRVYRPCCHGNLPMFIKGNNAQRDPAVTGDVLSAMTGGVIEGPVQGTVLDALGTTVYVAYADDEWYLTVDEDDTNIVCCFGIIIDDQRPIHYGDVRTGPPPYWLTPEEEEEYANLYSIRIIGPSCSSIEGRVLQ